MKTSKTKRHKNNRLSASRRIFSMFLAVTVLISLVPAMPSSAAPVNMAGGTVVTDIQGFNNAMSAGGNVKIILGADITLPQSAASRIPNSVTSLTVDGQGKWKLYDGYWASTGTATAGVSTNNMTPINTAAKTITFQNMNIYAGSQYGLLYSTSNHPNVKIVFDGCKIECTALSRLPQSDVTIVDCTIKSAPRPAAESATGATVERVVAGGNLHIGGKTKITKWNLGAGGNFPLLDNTTAIDNKAVVEILEGAFVEMDGGTSNQGLGRWYNSLANARSNFVVRKNATFVYKGTHFQNAPDTYQLYTFTCEEASTTILAVKGPLVDNCGILDLANTSNGNITVKRGATLVVGLQNQTGGWEATPVWFDGGNLVLDRPKYILFYSGGAVPAMGVYDTRATPTRDFTLTGIRQMRMYTNNSSTMGVPGASLDFDNPYVIGGDGELTVNYTNTATPTRFWGKYGLSSAQVEEQSLSLDYTDTGFNLRGEAWGHAAVTPIYNNTGYLRDNSAFSFTNYSGKQNIVAGAESNLTAPFYFTNGSSSVTKIIEVVGTYSDPPQVNDVAEGMRIVKGTGEPDSEIWIKFPDGTHQYTIVQPDGTWSVTCNNPFARNQNVYVTQRELVDGQFNDESPEILVNVLRKTVRLVPTSTAKIYTADMLGVAVNINEFNPEKFEIESVDYIVFDKPGYMAAEGVDNNPENHTYFNGIYESWTGKKGAVTMTRTAGGIDDYSGTIGAIDGNCEVWVRATLLVDGEMVYVYDTLEYKNIFEPVTIQARGVIKDANPTDVLYAYENISKPDGTQYGVYGIPYNIDGSVCDAPIGGYDTVQLSGKAYYAFYWTAGFKGGPLNYTLTLNQEFLSDNLNCDNSNPLRYTLDYEKNPAGWRDVAAIYVDEAGAPLAINGDQTGSISVPIDLPVGQASTHFYDYGGRYTPPHDDNNMPIGWIVGNNSYPGHNKAQSNFSDPSFNPQFSNITAQSLYVVYKTGQFTVLEKYADEANAPIDNDRPLTYDSAFPDDYDGVPKKIGGYVPVGYKVAGSNGANIVYTLNFDDYLSAHPGTLPTINQYNIFPSLLIGGADLVPPGGRGTVTITYIYARDGNNDGIPDANSTSVNVSWYGYKITGNIPAVLKEHLTINSRTGYTLDISNRYPGGGDVNEKVVFPVYHNYGGTWIFDKWRSGNDADRTVMMDRTQTDIMFVYGYATDGVTPDSRMYVTEKYNLLSTSDDNQTGLGTEFPAATVTSGIHYKQKASAYTKAPPQITGYIYMGYRIEDESGNPISLNGATIAAGSNINSIKYTNGSSPDPVSFSIAGNPERYTVVFLYREEAKPVSIAWIGETFGGTEVSIAGILIGGWLGENVTPLIADSAAVDADVWQYKSNNVPAAVVLTNTAQSYEYRYEELVNFATVTVRGISSDDKLAYEYSLTKKLNDAAFDVAAWPIPSYRIDGYTLTDTYGTVIGNGTGETYTVDPSRGSVTITFSYAPTITTVLVNIIDIGTGDKLDSHTFTDAVIGEKYAVKALYQNGWVLIGDLLQSVTVQEGTNRFNFNYQRATGNVSVLLREDGPGGQIIAAESENVTHGTTRSIAIPDLSGAYYTAISTDETMVDFTGAEPTPSTVEYYYKKDMMNVVIKAVDEVGTVLSTERYDNAARKGEMYYAVAPAVNWHTLTESREKTVYADPTAGDNTITVTFKYKADKTGDITVKYYYTDEKGDEAELYSYSGKGVVGGKFTAVAIDFDGFELIGTETEKEIIIANDNTVEFVYLDLRHTVTVKTKLGSAAAQNETVYKVVSGDDVAIPIPYKAGYVAKSYVLNGDEATKADIGSGFDKLTLEDVDDDMTVTFSYVTVDEASEEHYVLLTIKGKTGSRVHYSYVKRVANSVVAIILIDGVDVFTVPGYTLVPSQSFSVVPDRDREVVFEYATLSTSATIRMADGGGTDVANSFAVAATVGQPLTYYAPNVPGYYLVSGALGSIDHVAANGASEIVFTYAEITSNVTIVAKEDDASGRVLGVFEVSGATVGTKLYNVPDLSSAYYTTPDDKVSITYDGTNSASAEVYYTKELVDVGIEAADYRTGASVAAASQLASQRRGEAVTVNAPVVDDYVLVDGVTQTIIADTGAKAVFKYRTLEAGEVMVRAQDEEGNILQSYILSGTAGETVTAGPPVLLGWKTSEISKSAVVGTDKTIAFVYRKDVVTVTVREVDSDGAVISGYTAQAARGGDYTAYARHIAGYILDDDGMKALTGLTGAAQITFVYKTVQEYVDSTFVRVTIWGRASGRTLYSYGMLRQQGSGGYTVEAIEVNGYELLSASPATVTVGSDSVTQTFEYATLSTTATIRMVDGGGADVANSFAVAATVGQPLTYYAPNVPGYYLVSNALGSVDPVAANGASEIEFTYAEITSSVTIVAKEGWADGRVLGVFEVPDPVEGTELYDVPDLSGAYYTTPDDKVSITYDGTNSVSEEVYYTKELVDIGIEAADYRTGASVASSSQLASQRRGEAVTVNAPLVDDYLLVGGAVQTVIADSGAQAIFKYRTLEADEVMVRALDEEGNILLNYVLKGTVGEIILVEPPALPGYRTGETSKDALVGTDKTMAFGYMAASVTDAAREADIQFKYIKKSDSSLIKTETISRQQVGTIFTFGTAGAFNEGGRKYTRDASTPAIISMTINDTNEVPLYYNDTGAENTTTGGGSGDSAGYTTATLTVQGIDRATNKVVYSQSVKAVVGETETVTAPAISYYRLDSSNKRTQEITIRAGENKVVFSYNYTDITPLVILDYKNTDLIAKDNQYKDIPPTPDMAVDISETVKHTKYISGYEDGRVKPNNAITRAEVAVIFYRLLKESTKNGAVPGKFSDVNSNAWYGQAVNYLASLGILNGYDDGTFHPEKLITRAEFATIAAKFDEVSGTDSVIFADVPNTHWASAYINSAYLKGWISGYPDGSFKPGKSTTRAETVKIINAILNRRVELSDIQDNVSQYTDLDGSHWAYCEIIEAANEHTSVRKDNGYEIWE